MGRAGGGGGVARDDTYRPVFLSSLSLRPGMGKNQPK